MAAITHPSIREAPSDTRVPPLETGDRLTWPEFERRYAATPEVKKAELIEGVVYMPSPVSEDHSGAHYYLMGWLTQYSALTPGVAGGDNGTLRLDLDNAPQPDAYLRILASHGGQAGVDEKHFVVGAPELVAEVAVSSVSLDLHAKLHVYRRSGVHEYVVWRVEDRAIDWFFLREGRFEPLPLIPPGMYRSQAFPGLWLIPDALIGGDLPRVFQVVQEGLATSEHAEFVTRLQDAATQRPSQRP